MKTDIDLLTRKLSVYKERLYSLQYVYGYDCFTCSEIAWYEKEIDDIEADLAVADLIIQMHIGPIKHHKVVTNSLDIVKSIMIEEDVISLKQKYSLRHMKWFWHVEFNYKTR